MTPGQHEFFSGKRLVVFGAGYLGGSVAREAVRRGMKVTALTRNEAKAAVLRAEGVATVIADLVSHTWHDQVPARPEYVLNCVSSGGGGLLGYEHSYLGGMKSIIQWARTFGAVGTLVYTSSTSVYPQDGGVLVDESAAVDGDGERAGVLVRTENLVREAGEAASERWFILRLAGIYGPGRHHLLQQVREGNVAGRGEHHLNLIHRDDAVAAIWAAFQAGSGIRNEVLNVADDGAAPKSEITAWIAAQVGLPAPRFTGEPGEGRRRVTPDRIIANARLKKTLGWVPQYPGFREGYAAILRA